MPRRIILLLGALLVLGALLFGVVSYYYCEVRRPDTFFRYWENGVLVVRPEGPSIVFPLRDYHFLSYVFFFSGSAVLAYLLLTGYRMRSILAHCERGGMRRLASGVLIGFGSAVSLVVYAAWDLLQNVLESEYLIVHEAKVISAAETASHVGIVLGILLVFAGLNMELFAAATRRPDRIEEDNSSKSV